MNILRQFNPKFVLADLQANLSRISKEHNTEVLTKGYSAESLQTRIIQFLRLTFMLRGINKLFMARKETKEYRQRVKIQVRELLKQVAWLKKEMNKFDWVTDSVDHTLITKQDVVCYFTAREAYMQAKMELLIKQDILTNLNEILIKREVKKKPVKEPALVSNMQEFVDFYTNVVKHH